MDITESPTYTPGSSQPRSRASHPVLLAAAAALSHSSQNPLPLSSVSPMVEGSISGTSGVLRGQSLQVTYGKLPRAMGCLLPGAQQPRATPAQHVEAGQSLGGPGSGWQTGSPQGFPVLASCCQAFYQTTDSCRLPRRGGPEKNCLPQPLPLALGPAGSSTAKSLKLLLGQLGLALPPAAWACPQDVLQAACLNWKDPSSSCELGSGQHSKPPEGCVGLFSLLVLAHKKLISTSNRQYV